MTDDSGFRGLTAAQISERTRQPAEVVEHVLGEELALGRIERVDGCFRFTETGWRDVGAPLASITPGYVPGVREVGRVRW